MDKKVFWKWIILVAMAAWSLALVTPLKDKIKLGLDLKGGTSFTVEIDKAEIERQILQEEEAELSPQALQSRVKEAAAKSKQIALEVIRNRVDGLGIAEPIIYATTHKDQERIVIQLPGVDEVKRQEARDAILSVAFLEFRLVHKENEEWVEDLFARGKAPRGFKVSQTGDVYVRDKEAVSDEAFDKEFLKQLSRFEYRPGCALLLEKDEDPSGRIVYRPFYVEVRRQMTGDTVKSAVVEYHPVTREPRVSLQFDRSGGRKFASVTRDYAPGGPKNFNSEIGRQLAIVLDGTLYSAPVIREEIPSGRGEITGRFTVRQAMQLVNVLNAGALPAPVKIVETRTVDPSLGRDSISSGTRALMYGGICVVAFMLLYYLLAGLIANIALVLDIFLLPLGMMIAAGFLGLMTGASGGGAGATVGLPTLTLPGIAGIVLTIGMAVDANVLIFERIREEQGSGKRFSSAVSAGYDKVFSTIFDANVTTLITAVILFWQGSGPIRGFAVTLSAGILVSMYTALIVTRMLFDFIANRTNIRKVRMLAIVRDPNINFLGMKFVAAILSVLLIGGTWYMFIKKGQDNFGVDFTGGAAVTFGFDQKVPVEEVRGTLEGIEVTGALIQYHAEMAPDAEGVTHEYLELKVGFDEDEKSIEAITAAYPDANFKVLKEDSVGPQVGNELRRKGLWSIFWAMIGIVIYISFRFEFAFAIGAIVAVMHDVLITVGLYCLFGRELSLPVIAALLTIVGYSVNDTIVVFDRIREDLKLRRGRTYEETANKSINETLSRTLLTSITTLLSVAMLLVFGGGAINDFALTLFIGILIGTYSSIFVATPVMLLWHREEETA